MPSFHSRTCRVAACSRSLQVLILGSAIVLLVVVGGGISIAEPTTVVPSTTTTTPSAAPSEATITHPVAPDATTVTHEAGAAASDKTSTEMPGATPSTPGDQPSVSASKTTSPSSIPTTTAPPTSADGSQVQAFASPGCGMFLPSPFEVCGAILAKYKSMGGPSSFLLYPTSNEFSESGWLRKTIPVRGWQHLLVGRYRCASGGARLPHQVGTIWVRSRFHGLSAH